VNCKCEECKNTQDNMKSLGDPSSLKQSEDLQQILNPDNQLEGTIAIGDKIAPSASSQRERKVSMCSSTTASTILQTRKRTRSEALDSSLD